MKKYKILLVDYPARDGQLIEEVINRVLCDVDMIIDVDVPNQYFILYSFILQYCLYTNSFMSMSIRELKEVTHIGSNHIQQGLKYLIDTNRITKKPYVPQMLLDKRAFC